MITFIIASILLNLLILVIVLRLGSNLLILDYPNISRKSHKTPIPLAGGPIVILNVLLIFFSSI